MQSKQLLIHHPHSTSPLLRRGRERPTKLFGILQSSPRSFHPVPLLRRGTGRGPYINTKSTPDFLIDYHMKNPSSIIALIPPHRSFGEAGRGPTPVTFKRYFRYIFSPKTMPINQLTKSKKSSQKRDILNPPILNRLQATILIPHGNYVFCIPYTTILIPMQRLVIFILFCTISATAYAQNDSIYISNKWCASKDTLLLFNAENNIIQVYSKTLKPSDIILKPLDKTLRIGKPEIKGDTTSVLAMPYHPNNKPMRLTILNSKTKRVIKTVSFYSEDVPTPIARLGKIQTNEALRKDIIAQQALKVVFPRSLYNYPFTIKQYTFNIHHAKGGATIPVNGYYLTKHMLDEITAAPSGTIVEFTGIKATCPECVTRDLPDIKVKIK